MCLQPRALKLWGTGSLLTVHWVGRLITSLGLMGVMGSAWRGHLGGEGSSLVPDRVQGQHVPSWWNLWKDGSEGVMTEALSLGQALRGPGQPCRSGFSMFLHVERPGGRWKQTVGRPERLTQQVQVGLGCAVLASSGEGPGTGWGAPP